MHLKVYNDNGSITTHHINKDEFINNKYENRVSYISSSSKEINALNIFKSYFSNAKSILFLLIIYLLFLMKKNFLLFISLVEVQEKVLLH